MDVVFFVCSTIVAPFCPPGAAGRESDIRLEAGSELVMY
jgi:hypothetical protein